LLDVDVSADQAAIKKAYRKKSIEYHPDKNSSPGAQEKFNLIALANEILSDTVRQCREKQFLLEKENYVRHWWYVSCS
jgi:molecular chaperone DnaJ